MFPNLRDRGTLVRLPRDEQWRAIATMGKGTILSTHLRPEPRLQQLIDSHSVKPFFMLRDPRDVCVSLMHYILREPDHYFHRHLDSVTDEDRLLSAIISGYSEPRGDEHAFLSSIDSTFRVRLGWQSHPSCCTIRFENLVGSAGGGDDLRQHRELGRIAEHLGLSLAPERLEWIGVRAFSTKTTTFRRGRVGGWRETFTPAHTRLFKEVAGPLLVELGYEVGLDW
jgi:hypothetical protein